MDRPNRNSLRPIIRIDPRLITGVATAVTAFVGRAASGPVNQAIAIESFSDFQNNFGGLWQGSELGYAIQDFFVNGGTQALMVRLQNASSAADPLTPADYLPVGGAPTHQGLYALEQVAAFNLLVLSPDRGPAGATDVDPTVIAAAVVYCEQRGAMLLIDPPAAWTSVAVAQAAMSNAATPPPGVNSSNAALYFPRLRKDDPLADDAVTTFAPGGAVAGVISRTDALLGAWRSPAGTAASLAGILGLSVGVSDVQNGLLQSLAINCLRTLPHAGAVVFGARTLAGSDATADQFKYIPVRRTAMYIEQSLRSGLAWTASEPNHETLWTAVRLSVGPFLQGLFQQGALQGTTPQQAYFVKCDEETTTQADVSQGVLNVVVGFAPLKPAEFVVLQLRLTAETAAQ